MAEVKVQNPNWINTDLIHEMLDIIYDDKNWKEDRLENLYRQYKDNGMYINFLGTLIKYLQNNKHYIVEEEYTNLTNYIHSLPPNPDTFIDLAQNSPYKEVFQKITMGHRTRLGRSRTEVVTQSIANIPGVRRNVLVVNLNDKGVIESVHHATFVDEYWRDANDGVRLELHPKSYWFEIPR